MASGNNGPADRFTREEFNSHTRMFDDIDRNHDGVLDLLEFQAYMEGAHLAASRPRRGCFASTPARPLTPL